ncbi:MAG TPA: class I SAM-dependent methyltransferase [Acidimicrobiia bacterium]|nr:class I SAM-dependent methyltransferase [Acidimicrobiia bacterium]
MTVNLWSEASHARDYLARRQSIPHRDEGYAAVLEFLPPAPRRVLDLGTGDGELLARIRAVHPDADGVAADFSAEMLERARARFAADPAVTVVEHDLNEGLPDPWGTFDVVVSSFAIHHLDHRRKRGLYREVRDRLEPGGVFCNLEHVDSATPELHDAFLVAIGSSRADDDPSNQLLDVGTQLAWLRELGFEQVDCHWKWRELALLAGVAPG